MPTPPTFSVGQYNTAAYMNSIGLWLVKSQAVATSPAPSSVTVTGAFSSDYDNYLITYTGGTQSNNVNLDLSLGSSTTGYYSVLIYTSSVSTTPLAASIDNGTAWNWVGGGRAGQASHLRCDLLGPYLSIYTKLRNGSYQNDNNYGAMNGEHRVASSYTSFTIYAASGTLSGGTIRVYGYRN
jgi:hypothetical protein